MASELAMSSATSSAENARVQDSATWLIRHVMLKTKAPATPLRWFADRQKTWLFIPELKRSSENPSSSQMYRPTLEGTG